MSENRMNESEFVKKLKSLPRSIRPQRDLWPGIEDRLSPGSYGFGSGSAVSNWRMPAMAAAVFAALTTGIFIGRGMSPDTVPWQQHHQICPPLQHHLKLIRHWILAVLPSKPDITRLTDSGIDTQALETWISTMHH